MAIALRIWQQMHECVRQQLRTELGKDEQSSVAIADSQSVKTTEKKEPVRPRGFADLKQLAWEVYGFDGGKKVKGRKRHIVLDSQGLLLGVFVTEANASERLGAVIVLDEAKEKLSQLEVIWVYRGYSGKNFANALKQVCGELVLCGSD